MMHHLKINQKYLVRILSGEKTFEVRNNDRDYQVGDEISFMPLESEHHNVWQEFRDIPTHEITYVHSGLGMEPGWVILSIKPILMEGADNGS